MSDIRILLALHTWPICSSVMGSDAAARGGWDDLDSPMPGRKTALARRPIGSIAKQH